MKVCGDGRNVVRDVRDVCRVVRDVCRIDLDTVLHGMDGVEHGLDTVAHVLDHIALHDAVAKVFRLQVVSQRVVDLGVRVVVGQRVIQHLLSDIMG